MARRLRVLYVFTARKARLVERAAQGEDPDTLLFGFNHLVPLGIDASFHEPEYGALGRALSRQIGRLGPDVLQLRTLRRFPAFDVVFLTGAWPLLLAARTIPRHRRPKLVWLNMTLTNVLRRGGAAARLLRTALRFADRIVCVARFQQTYLHGSLGIPMARLPLALSGTDVRFYDPDSGPAADPAAPGGRPYVLAAGRDAGRDYGTLLDATRDNQYDVHLVCSPANLAGLSVPAGATVRYDIAPAALRAEYAGASAVAVPTRGDVSYVGSDCSGTLVLLDALAMGRPAVITDRASVHDYVTAGEHVLCVPPGKAAPLGEALDRLMHDRDFSAQLAAAGRERVLSGLSTRHFAGRLVEVFRDVVA